MAELTHLTLDLTTSPDVPNDASTLSQAVQALKITDESSFAAVAEIVQTCAERRKKIEDFFEESKTLANRAHKSITSRIALMIAPFVNVENIGKNNMKAFRQKQIEEKRIADQKAQMEALAKQRQLEANAQKLRRQGELAQAREVQQQAQTVEVVTPVKAEAPKVEGVTEKRPWVGEVADVMELIKAIAEGRYPLVHEIPMRGGAVELIPILTVDMRVVTHYAKRLGVDMQVPGCKSREDIQFSMGARR